LARLERLNPTLNAYCTMTAELARTTAQAAEAAVMHGAPLGPLHGVPYSLKDLTPTKGIRTTFGSKIFEHHVPTEDAILVERLRAAGSILLGKTNTPEFGCKGMTDNKIFGTTYNPWNLERTPGGSSGGAGTAVAAGLGPLAEGSDLAGSIRMPASFCGVVGFKPSQGRIPRYPNGNAWNTMSVHGPLTRTVADDVGKAETARTTLYQRVRQFFEQYDLLLLPTTVAPPYPAHGGYPTTVAGRSISTPYEILLLTYAFNVTGQPAISVPAGWTTDGLPIGLQIVGRRHADALVLRAAAAFEAAAPWAHRRPPVD
jgi:Asp-tRNA(Asn)/Glu-tRNA(Gln) amidotransferase A subunit family amidase